MSFPLALVVSAIAGYLLGAIPSGVLVARTRGVDLTKTGSGRTGATNVLRSLGPGAAALCFAGDFLKGAVAVLVARALSDNAWPPRFSATATRRCSAGAAVAAWSPAWAGWP
jgi:acyl-phosphate glycerol 3-phosphate acyltransferase